MKVYQREGYSQLTYVVDTLAEWHTMTRWCLDNDVTCCLCSDKGGYSFRILKNFDWFVLRWGVDILPREW